MHWTRYDTPSLFGFDLDSPESGVPSRPNVRDSRSESID